MGKSSFETLLGYSNRSNAVFNSDTNRLFAKSSGNKAAQKFFGCQKGGLTKGLNSFKKKNGIF